MKKAFWVLVTVVFVFASCVSTTMVQIESNVADAQVLIDGKPVGSTPTRVELSNALWSASYVQLRAEGYKPYNGSIDKQLKGVNLAFGLTLWWPSLLYAWGPQPYQYYELIPE